MKAFIPPVFYAKLIKAKLSTRDQSYISSIFSFSNFLINNVKDPFLYKGFEFRIYIPRNNITIEIRMYPESDKTASSFEVHRTKLSRINLEIY